MDYKVTDTREISRMTAAGSEIKLYRVWLVTESGATGTVDVPQSKWTKEELPQILRDKAASLDLAFSVSE